MDYAAFTELLQDFQEKNSYRCGNIFLARFPVLILKITTKSVETLRVTSLQAKRSVNGLCKNTDVVRIKRWAIYNLGLG